MTGLNLLHLLVQNRTAEFHSQLEVLSAEALASGPVRFAVHLEQSLMEGAYNKVLAAAASETDLASTGWFTQRLAKTVQDEVAACAQAAYDSLPLSAAQQLLRLDSPAVLGPDVSDSAALLQPLFDTRRVVDRARGDGSSCGSVPLRGLSAEVLSKLQVVHTLRDGSLCSRILRLVDELQKHDNEISS